MPMLRTIMVLITDREVRVRLRRVDLPSASYDSTL